MKIIIVTGNEVLGNAFAAQKHVRFERNRSISSSAETFDADIVREYRKIDGATDVAFIRVDELSADDAARIANATIYAESGAHDDALAQLDGCSDRYSRPWIEARERVDFIAPPTDERLSRELRVAIARRAAIFARLFENHKGGIGALAREKEPGTPGPGTILAFMRHVVATGRLPINDFGVAEFSNQPRGDHSYHVGWTHHLYGRPSLFLDCAWWTCRDVLMLFSMNDSERESATEMIARVPQSLYDWRAFQIAGHNGFDVDAFDAARVEFDEIIGAIA
jgi:hypothetical protein